MQDLKYLTSFSIPVAAIMGLLFREYWVFFTPLFAFVFVPLLEVMLPVKTRNLNADEVLSKKKNKFFNFLLYLNFPLVFAILSSFLWTSTWAEYQTYELVGLVISVGIVAGSNGINVAHELGHRGIWWEKMMGKLLLLPSLYMHFFIEHNYGHHQNAATPEDPASARYNQTVYSFWFSSMARQYINAWVIQFRLLKSEDKSFFSLKNDMFWYTLIQIGYLTLVSYFFGINALWMALGIALTGALLLETINYIEHYGLLRNKKPSGRYERVSEIHSWNSNHVLGRVMLYELTRHSDHHYKSHKKYQLLDYHDVSPQMPFGYPTSMVLSLIPPLWFAVMNKRIPSEMKP